MRRAGGVVALLLRLLPLLLLLPPPPPARAATPPAEDKDAEQRRALSGLTEGDADPDPAPPNGDGRDESSELVPERHLVKKGETLWGICESYFHDPWRWPKVWALNPEVTNPHWIFPGQTLKLGGMTRSVPGAADDGAGTTVKTIGMLRSGPPRGAPAAANGGALREVGFVDAKELELAGTINGSREEKIMLATGDQAYIQFSRDRPLKSGQRLTVYQVDTDHPVKEPGSSTVLGYLVRIYGDVTIDALTDLPIASGTLLDLVQPVERGYRVGPLFHQFKTIKPRRNPIDTTARVVAAVQPNTLIAEGMLVVLNRGTRHGVEVGNRFVIVRQGDGYRRTIGDWDTTDARFPPDAVAEVIAVDVRDEASVGWVTSGNRPVRLGDVADMRKGR
jgi:hypothetical protein